MATVVDGVPVVMPPPKGYVVDFEHPQQNSQIAAYWIFGFGNFLCLLFMLQRVYVRLFIQKMMKWDDACLAVAYVFSTVLQVLILRDFTRGIMGVHSWEMSLTKFTEFLRALYLLPILYNPVQCGAKMALLLVYRRLAPQYWFKWMVWGTMFVVIGSSVAITFAAIFPCKPLQSAWDLSITDGTCINRSALYQATALLGAITDVMVLIVPIPVVIPLQITRKQKIGLIAFFSIGGVTVFTSIMRLIALINSLGVVDQSWGGGPVLLWIFAEANLSCICASLPTIKVFTKHLWPRLLGTTDPSSKPSGLDHSNAPATIGGSGNATRNRYDKYQRFDDGPMYPLNTLSAVEAGKYGKENSQWDVQRTSGDGQGDSGSETAIMDKSIIQTRVTTVSYSS